MTIVSLEKISTIKSSTRRASTKTICVCICDQCHCEFIKSRCIKQVLTGNLHFCKMKCMRLASRKNGIVFQKKIETCLQTFGVMHPQQSLQIQKQTEETNLTRHGVKRPAQNPKFYSSGCKKFKIQVIQHWFSQQFLKCVSSYETAFVNWANTNKVDFDWQIPHKMPDGKVYIIDAFIKTGEFANTWIEIKGFFYPRSKEKWGWFHFEHPNNSQLWNFERLTELKILVESNSKCIES